MVSVVHKIILRSSAMENSSMVNFWPFVGQDPTAQAKNDCGNFVVLKLCEI
jgi:hypothetical protein